MAPEKLPVGFAISGIDPSPCAHRFGVRTVCASSLLSTASPSPACSEFVCVLQVMILCCSCLLILGNDLIFSSVLGNSLAGSSSPISFLVLPTFAFSSCLRLILSFFGIHGRLSFFNSHSPIACLGQYMTREGRLDYDQKYTHPAPARN